MEYYASSIYEDDILSRLGLATEILTTILSYCFKFKQL